MEYAGLGWNRLEKTVISCNGLAYVEMGWNRLEKASLGLNMLEHAKKNAIIGFNSRKYTGIGQNRLA